MSVPKSNPKPESKSKKVTAHDGENFEDYFDIISRNLDDNLYENLYSSKAGEFELSMSENFSDLKSFKSINSSLKIAKVSTFVLSIFFALYSITNMSKPVKSLTCLFIAVDLLRVSYNCYIKNYLSMAAKTIGGDFKKLSSSILKSASCALGLGGEDPFVKLRKEVTPYHIICV